MATPPYHLVHFRVSHYNEKVRWALDHKGCPHTREALLPGFHLLRARRLTGQNKLPILVIEGAPMYESSRILAELERRHPDPPLYPRDPAARARAVGIEAHFDEHVAPDLRRLFWSTYLDRPRDCATLAAAGFSGAARNAFRAAFPVFRPIFRRNMGADAARVGAARERLVSHFERLESEIGPSGYLVGDRFGIADLAAASVMTAIIRPPQFPYPLPEPWPPELVALRASVSERPGFRWVLDMYARHRGTSSEVAASAPQS